MKAASERLRRISADERTENARCRRRRLVAGGNQGNQNWNDHAGAKPVNHAVKVPASGRRSAARAPKPSDPIVARQIQFVRMALQQIRTDGWFTPL